MGRNRLTWEASPYLLMHADNPVDWYPWGPAALARAAAENKPILLSIGYAACHWCHVMARESFENQETARLMNERFVNVKVDREERPEVDATYMQALTRMGRPGGWPLTLFLMPDGKPFWGGTYFPPEPRHGAPAFREVLEGISDLYRRHPGQVSKNAETAMSALTQAAVTAAPGGPPEDAAARAAADALARIDWDRGGLVGATKFPHTPLFRFLWRHGLRTSDSRCRDAVRATLDGLVRGGIRDHLGGGFARYSVDADWRVPHFEKMLSDNALILGLLADAWKATGEFAYAQAARETAAWALREMTTEDGAFATSLAAESEGREGAFYTWAAAEVDALLGPDTTLFKAAYGVTATGDLDGRCVLHRLAGPAPRDAA
ncbi:MAG: thioredoxin domain-containing protein, partial [Kiloniellales bacterium]